MNRKQVAVAKIVSAFNEPQNVAAETARAFAQLNEARYATPGTKEHNGYRAALKQIDAIAAELRKARK